MLLMVLKSNVNGPEAFLRSLSKQRGSLIHLCSICGTNCICKQQIRLQLLDKIQTTALNL